MRRKLRGTQADIDKLVEKGWRVTEDITERGKRRVNIAKQVGDVHLVRTVTVQ